MTILNSQLVNAGDVYIILIGRLTLSQKATFFVRVEQASCEEEAIEIEAPDLTSAQAIYDAICKHASS